MRINKIKSFCLICGNIFDNGRLKLCNHCKGKLTKVTKYDQTFSERNGTYTLKLNHQTGGKQ